MGGKAKLGIVGALNSFIQNVRQKGFEEVVKAAPGVTIAGIVDGRNVQDNAMAAAENLMTANPGYDGDLRHRRAGAAGRRRRGREPGPPGRASRSSAGI